MLMDVSRLDMVADTMDEKRWLLNVFFVDAKGYVQQMHYALQHTDCLLYKESAHSLGGAAANLGMQQLEQRCSRAAHLTNLRGKQPRLLLSDIEDALTRLQDYNIAHPVVPNHV